jgi:talin
VVHTASQEVPTAIVVNERPVAEEGRVVILGLNESRTDVTLRMGMNGLEAALAVGSILGVSLREEFGLAFPEKKGWLDEEYTLEEQGVAFGDELIYKKKYFIADEELARSDEDDVRLMYPQCVDGLVNGFFKCTQGHVVGLAALQARVFQAQHDGAAPSIQELAEFLPLEYRDGATVKCVIDTAEGMSLMSGMDAMYQLVHICTSLEGYGITWYIVSDSFGRRVAGGPLEKIPVLMGIGRDGVYRANHKTKETLEKYPLSMIEQWACSKETFIFDFGANRENGHWGISTRAGRKIAQILLGYQRLLAIRDQLVQSRKAARIASGSSFVLIDDQ